jgi:HSP20 family protein
MALPVRRKSSNDAGDVTRSTSVLDQIDRLHQDLASYLDSWRSLPDLLGREGFTPAADVEETGDAYLIEIELPGVKRDDLDIEVSGRRVAVHGERKERERVGFFRKRERTVGRFSYDLTLPGDLDEDHVHAHLDEGVLTVRLPKPEGDRPRRIPIH